MACDEIDAEVASCLFDLGNGADGGGVRQYADPSHVWDQLVKQGEPFGVEFASQDAHPGDVSPWSRHAGYERAADHVVGEPDDRDSRGRALRGPDSWIARYYDYVDGSRDEVGGQRGKAVIAPVRPHENVPDVAPVLPAERPHVLSESDGQSV